MHRISTAGAALALLCLAAQALAAAPFSADPPQAWIAANARLQTEVERAEKSGRELPRLTDPKGRPLIQAALDERIFSGMSRNDPIAFMDQSSLKSICLAAIQLAWAYEVHGLNPAPNASPPSPMPAAARLRMSRNEATYQDEEALAFGFATTCFAQQISAAKRSFDAIPKEIRTPEAIEGIRLTMIGAAQLYLLVLQKQDDGAFGPADRTLMLNRAAQYADAYALLLAPAFRKAAVHLVDVALPSASPANRAKLLRIREVMSRPCAGWLCTPDPAPPAMAAARAR